jgi:nitroreductase
LVENSANRQAQESTIHNICEPIKSHGSTSTRMNVFEAIKTRRSVRKYKPQPIPEDHLRQIMAAAQLAPSAGNRQPWRFILVKDPETKKQLGTIARNQTWISDAGVIVAALAMDKKNPEVYERWAERDVMTAVEHMVLAAWELGYGTCWIGAFNEEQVKELLKVPREMTVINLLPIGVPDQTPEPRGRKSLEELFHLDLYGNPLKA